MTPIARSDTTEWVARIEEMIEEYRAAKQRQLMQRAIKLSRKAEARQQLVELEAQPERVH